ncbi:MAG: hypothetical protein U1E60_18130 [Reyranellaceae bacterium]
MRRLEGIWSALHLMVVLTSLTLLGTSAVAETSLTLTGVPAAGGGAHALAMIVEEPAIDWPIVLRRNDSGSPARVCVDVTPLIGPGARPVDNLRLTLDGKPGEACVDVDALGQAVVRLSGALPVEGDFKGQLGLIVGGARTPYDVTVTRRKPASSPKVGIVGLGSDGKLALSSDRAATEWPIAVRRDDALTGDVDVRLSVGPFTGPSGTTIQPTLLRGDQPLTAPLKLPPLGQASLKLVGTANLEGAYTGEISYEVGGVRTPVVLTLTRTRPDFDLKVEAIPKLRGVVGDGVTIQLRLQNATSASRQAYLPLLARLDRLDGTGAAPVEVGAPPYTISYALPDGAVPPQPVTIAADGGLDLRMSIKGLDEPGNYKGIIRFSAPDRKPQDMAFELSLRLPLLAAAFSIGLGVVGAAFLRYFQQTARPRLLLQRDAAGLRSSLQALSQAEGGNLDSNERQAIVFLVTELDEASDQLAAPDSAIDTVSARIDSVRRKLPLLPIWIAARRQLDGVRPQSVAAALRPALVQAYRALMNRQATDQDVTSARTAVDGIDAQIEQKLREIVLAAAERIKKAIDGLDVAARVEFRPVLDALAAVGTPAAPQPLSSATTALDRARMLYAQIAATRLRSRLDPTRVAIGFDAAEWRRFTADIAALLDEVTAERDPERRVDRWNEANRRYLVEVVGKSKPRVDALIAASSDPAATAALKVAAASLAAAEAALANDDLSAASLAHAAAMAEVAKAQAPLMVVMGQLSVGGSAATAPAPNAAGDVPPSVVDAAIGAIIPVALGRGVTVADVNRDLRNFSVGFAVVILVFAIVSGLQVLYVPNPAFGFWDLAVAFLWGAGLHAVAGQAFQGLQGLGQQFR